MSELGNNNSQSNDTLLEELSQFCRSESLSEDGLREMIERHNCAPNNNDPNIDYKFFRRACRNESVTEGIIRYLLEYFPNAARHCSEKGRLPIHIICRNKNVTRGMVQLLIDAFPEFVEDNKGRTPLHHFCQNINLDDEEGRLKTLKLLIERCPESVRHATNDGHFSIHSAAAFQSPKFCRILIEAYPGSERITYDNDGALPFHRACGLNTVATAKYFYQLYPEGINMADNDGYYPIHCAIWGLKFREDKLETAIEMVQFLLDCDPDVILQKLQGKSSLYWACNWATNENTRRLNVYLKVIQILYDAQPEVIDEVASYVDRFCQEVQTFINNQLIYARQVRDRTLMHSTDEDGRLPLHRALRGLINNVTLGSIKLLVKGYPSAITCADNRGMIPLHVACQHHESPRIVEYMLDLDPSSSRALDFDDNTALHYACRAANHAIIALLLDKYGSMSVSKRNANNQLPVDLLFASEAVSDKESVKYIESIYRLIRANPETLMHYDLGQTCSEDCLSQQNKKRKIEKCNVEFCDEESVD